MMQPLTIIDAPTTRVSGDSSSLFGSPDAVKQKSSAFDQHLQSRTSDRREASTPVTPPVNPSSTPSTPSKNQKSDSEADGRARSQPESSTDRTDATASAEPECQDTECKTEDRPIAVTNRAASEFHAKTVDEAPLVAHKKENAVSRLPRKGATNAVRKEVPPSESPKSAQEPESKSTRTKKIEEARHALPELSQKNPTDKEAVAEDESQEDANRDIHPLEPLVSTKVDEVNSLPAVDRPEPKDPETVPAESADLSSAKAVATHPGPFQPDCLNIPVEPKRSELSRNLEDRSGRIGNDSDVESLNGVTETGVQQLEVESTSNDAGLVTPSELPNELAESSRPQSEPNLIGTAAPLARFAQHLAAKPGERTAKSAPLTDVEHARLVDRVARAFKAAEDRGGVVTLRLSPPELGTLRIELRIQDGALSARLEAETAAAKTVLVENAQTLRDRLAEQGVQLERFDVDLRDQHSSSESPSFEQHRSHEQTDRRFGAPPRVTAPEPTDLDPGPTTVRSNSTSQLNVIV